MNETETHARVRPVVVMKFGGSSIATAENWQRIAGLLEARLAEGLRPVLVLSAVRGTTNLLERLVRNPSREDPDAIVSQVREIHMQLAGDLGLEGTAILDPALEELRAMIHPIRGAETTGPRSYASIIAQGELLSTRLGQAWLQQQGLAARWLDARELLQSTDHPNCSEQSAYLAADCSYEPDEALRLSLDEMEDIAVTQGFMARNRAGDTVILGRGGSDTSAAYLAAKLLAERLEIWTDVPGMFSANPNQVSGARRLRELSYAEAQEIASTGGTVLHPRCISPVSRYRIPLWVLCTSHPQRAGTVIGADAGGGFSGVKAISSRGNITLVSMETLSMWHEPGFLARAFKCFASLGLSIDLVSTSASNVTVTLDPVQGVIDAGLIRRLENRLGRFCRVRIMHNVAVVSLVGRKIRAKLHEMGPALELFEEHRVHMVCQAANDLNLSFVVDIDQAPRLVQKLHDVFIRDDAAFGETWQSLTLSKDATGKPGEPAGKPWWMVKRQQLTDLARTHSSAYVYDLDTVRRSAAELKGLTPVSRVFYAVKANSNPDVLAAIRDCGLNFECVSPGELNHVLGLFPDLEPGRILFTPNFAPRVEYEQALREKIWVTMDNLHPLRHWKELLQDREILLRIDPGYSYGHHESVRTAGVHSKFGIPVFELDEARALADAAGARVIGLHAHTGSGIFDSNCWAKVGQTLAPMIERFPSVRILNLGGGLGVPDRPGQMPLDMQALNDSLADLKKSVPGIELWLEPGRYVTASAGVLVSTVTQVKGKGEKRYVGISTGMNSLIRPALYGAYHEIANLDRLDEAATDRVTVVGPNCESGDRLGIDRQMPPAREGDVLVIANAGAYGQVMSSRYNLRQPAPEMVI